MAEPADKAWRDCHDPECGSVHPRGCHGHVKARDGEPRRPCSKSPIRGGTVCPQHGGNAGQVRKTAAKNLDRAKKRQALATYMRGLGTPPDIDPRDALLTLISWKNAEVEFLREKVMTIEDGDIVWGEVEYTDQTGMDYGTKRVQKAAPSIWLELYHRAQDQLATYTTKAIAAGLEERRVRVAESIGVMVIGVLRAISMDVQVAIQQAGAVPGVLDAYQLAFDDAAHRHLRALRGGGDDEPQQLTGGN